MSMTKPRKKRRDEEETLTVFPPLYPEGAFPMTPPVFPNTGASELEDPEEPERWDL
jgi:hypothetical protein